jgi:oligoribonuclease
VYPRIMSRFAVLDAADETIGLPANSASETIEPPSEAIEPPCDTVEPPSDAVEPIAGLSSKPAREVLLDKPLFWIDCEFTGLDASKDTILELAVIVSDGELRNFIEGPSLVIHHDAATLGTMNEWSTRQHASSGLTQRCRASDVSLAQAEAELLAFVERHCPAGSLATLAGACVYKDKEFLDACMPRLRGRLSHRVVDVSSIRELAWRWMPRQARQAPKSECAHRALDDIRHSIEELKYYRRAMFRASPAPGGSGSPGGAGGAGRPSGASTGGSGTPRARKGRYR